MTTLTLRKVGGSTMLALPPALLQILGRRAGEQVVIKPVFDTKITGSPECFRL